MEGLKKKGEQLKDETEHMADNNESDNSSCIGHTRSHRRHSGTRRTDVGQER